MSRASRFLWRLRLWWWGVRREGDMLTTPKMLSPRKDKILRRAWEKGLIR